MIKILLICYLVISINFFLSLQLSITSQTTLKANSSAKQRETINKSINKLKEQKKYFLLWPHVLYKLIRDNVE